jgi:tetratricopeptide (TPR) repeat protein
MASIRQRLAAAPKNTDLAAAAAEGYIKMGNDESDPRFYGYARSAIAAWWDADSPVPTIARLRAKLKEKDHQYAEAILDLEHLLEDHPRDAQAWIELVNLYRVVGNYKKAFAANLQLTEFADSTTVFITSTPLQAATGKSEEANEAVKKALIAAKQNSHVLLPWLTATAANIAALRGDVTQADTYFRDALQLTPNNIHLKRTYADFLLDLGRPEPVLPLLKEHQNDNGCLLLMAVAAQRLKQAEATEKMKSMLATRFTEIRLRGSRPHGRFESRYQLELKNEPDQALETALENWKLQKETRDTRAVLEAALAADNRAAAEPAILFVKDSGNEDIALNRLIEKLEQK